MMNQETRNGYFAELCIRLQKEGFTTKPPKDGLLPVPWNGRPLCRITESGSIRYRQQDMIDVDTQLACDRAIDVATVTIEYMKLMEQAPPLKANGLEEGYKLLAEFNGTVLAGHPTRCGTEFITWDRIQNNTALWQGHYYSSYTAAKQDFASRTGLIDKHQLFSPEQLTEIYRSIHETLDEAYPIISATERQCVRHDLYFRRHPRRFSAVWNEIFPRTEKYEPRRLHDYLRRFWRSLEWFH